MAKGQTSIETVFSVFILLLILTFAIMLTIFERRYNEDVKNALDVRGNCWKLSSFISETFASGDGISVDTDFIQSYTFEVFPNSKFIYAVSDLTGADASCTLLTNRVSNASNSTSSIPNSFLLQNITTLMLNNSNGLVVVYKW